MKTFQNVYKKLVVPRGTTGSLKLKQFEIMNTKLTFVIKGVDADSIANYISIYIQAGSKDDLVNLANFSEFLYTGENRSIPQCILAIPFPIACDVLISVNAINSSNDISIGVYACNY